MGYRETAFSLSSLRISKSLASAYHRKSFITLLILKSHSIAEHLTERKFRIFYRKNFHKSKCVNVSPSMLAKLASKWEIPVGNCIALNTESTGSNDTAFSTFFSETGAGKHVP